MVTFQVYIPPSLLVCNGCNEWIGVFTLCTILVLFFGLVQIVWMAVFPLSSSRLENWLVLELCMELPAFL